MEIEPVATFRSPLTEKFGIPRQSGLVGELRGQVVLNDGYRHPEALKGLEGFDFVWLIWEFDRVPQAERASLTVRPPRLGGNHRVGVFASRSPFRPNRLALSSVRIESVDAERGVINVLGADLADGTPIYDIKPYVEYADSHPGVRCGFVDEEDWSPLEVSIPDSVAAVLDSGEIDSLRGILSQDPRPAFQRDSEREYGMSFAGHNIRFRVCDGVAEVIGISEI